MKLPFWTTREFRWLVLILVLASASWLVVQFEIRPLLKSRNQEPSELTGGDLRRLLDAAPPPAGDPRFAGKLAGAADSTPVELEDEGYLFLVDYLSRSRPGSLSSEALDLDHRAMKKFPGELRGRVIRFHALFLEAAPITVGRKFGRTDLVFRTFAIDPEFEQGYVVDLLESPRAFERRTPVSMEAVFYKIGAYEGKKGRVEAPFLVGRSIQAARPSAASAPIDPRYLLAGIAAASVGLVALSAWIWWNRRPARRAR